MFSGIIRSMGVVRSIHTSGTTKRLVIGSPISHTLKIDQSLSHDGVCLTIIEVLSDAHAVEVVLETLSKTTFQNVRIGQYINLEASITPTTLLDGHIVQGHIDTVLICEQIDDLKGSWKLRFNLPAANAGLVIPQGSICLNGVSLTIANLYDDAFDVAIIPFTFEHTNFKFLKPGDSVNAEFDLIGKYLLRQASL